MKKRLIKNLLLILTMVVLCFAVGVMASAEDRAIIDSGECGAQGDNVIWTLYDDGELVISGEGKTEKITHLEQEKVKNLIIEDGITELGEGAFAFFDYMEMVFISDTVEVIDDNAFNSCHNIISFIVSDNNQNFSNDEYGVLFNKDKTVLLKYPQMSMYEQYIIPDTVETIGYNAFDYNCTLFKIVIPESVKKIEGAAFNQCVNLREIVFPGTVKQLLMIGETNPSLTTVTIKDGVENIGKYFLMYSPVLKSVYVEDMDVDIEEGFLYSDIYVSEELCEEYLDFLYRAFWSDNAHWSDFNYGNEYMLKLQDYYLIKEGTPFVGTIYCHSGSTAEAYAIENGIDYELMHFYEDEWTYDYDNCAKYRKCIHCDEIETEELIPETPAEPDVPTDEDAKEPLYVQLFDLIKMFFALIASLFRK